MLRIRNKKLIILHAKSSNNSNNGIKADDKNNGKYSDGVNKETENLKKTIQSEDFIVDNKAKLSNKQVEERFAELEAQEKQNEIDQELEKLKQDPLGNIDQDTEAVLDRARKIKATEVDTPSKEAHDIISDLRTDPDDDWKKVEDIRTRLKGGSKVIRDLVKQKNKVIRGENKPANTLEEKQANLNDLGRDYTAINDQTITLPFRKRSKQGFIPPRELNKKDLDYVYNKLQVGFGAGANNKEELGRVLKRAKLPAKSFKDQDDLGHEEPGGQTKASQKSQEQADLDSQNPNLSPEQKQQAGENKKKFQTKKEQRQQSAQQAKKILQVKEKQEAIKTAARESTKAIIRLATSAFNFLVATWEIWVPALAIIVLLVSLLGVTVYSYCKPIKELRTPIEWAIKGSTDPSSIPGEIAGSLVKNPLSVITGNLKDVEPSPSELRKLLEQVCNTNPCPTGVSSNGSADTTPISSSSSGGTVSKGGPFTSEVRAFLDAIAKWESNIGGPDKLGIESYNSSQNGGSAFNAADYKNSFPHVPQNIGRYQVLVPGGGSGDDVTDAKVALKSRNIDPNTVTGFNPESQDLIALGRWYRNANIKHENRTIGEVLQSGNFAVAAGIASMEWASAPVVPGYHHADSGQSLANLQTYQNYYNQRLQYYKSNPSAYTPDDSTNQNSLLADASNGNGDLKLNNLIQNENYSFNPFGNINVDAADSGATNTANAQEDINYLVTNIQSGKIRVWERNSNERGFVGKAEFIYDIKNQPIHPNLARFLVYLTKEKNRDIQINALGDKSHGFSGGKHNEKPFRAADIGGSKAGSGDTDSETLADIKSFLLDTNSSGLVEATGVGLTLANKAGATVIYENGQAKRIVEGTGSLPFAKPFIDNDNNIHFSIKADGSFTGQPTGNASSSTPGTNPCCSCKDSALPESVPNSNSAYTAAVPGPNANEKNPSQALAKNSDLLSDIKQSLFGSLEVNAQEQTIFQKIPTMADTEQITMNKAQKAEPTMAVKAKILKEIYSYGKQAKLTDEQIIFVMALHPTESGGFADPWKSDNGLGYFGIYQMDAPGLESEGWGRNGWKVVYPNKAYPSSPVETFKNDPLWQMATVPYVMKSKLSIYNSSWKGSRAPDAKTKSDIYKTAYAWLKMGPENETDGLGTKTGDYGVAAEKNYKLISGSDASIATNDSSASRISSCDQKKIDEASAVPGNGTYIPPAPGPNAKDDGSRPQNYSELTQKHRDFMAKIAGLKGYPTSLVAPVKDESKLLEIDGKKVMPEASGAFTAMKTKAAAENVDLVLLSGYRSYDDQVGTFFNSGNVTNPIPDSKIFKGDPNDQGVIDAYKARTEASAPVGHSEHHTGYALDIVGTDSVSKQLNPDTYPSPLKSWLASNASKYGFKLSYPEKSSSGASYEPWHWLFIGNDTYKKTSSLDVQPNSNQALAKNSDLLSDIRQSLFGSLEVNAEGAVDIKQQRQRLKTLIQNNNIYSLNKTEALKDVEGFYKDNLILMFLKLYDSGLTFVISPINGSARSFYGSDHNYGRAADIWGFARRNGQDIVINGFTWTGNVGDIHNAVSPSRSGNAADPRVKRMIDANLDPEVIKIYGEAIKIVKDSGVLRISPNKGEQIFGHDALVTAGYLKQGQGHSSVPHHDNHLHFAVDDTKPFGSSTGSSPTTAAPCVPSSGSTPTTGSGGPFDGKFINPLGSANAVFTACFGLNSCSRHGRMHKGIDMALPPGNKIIASEAGEAKLLNDPNGYGNYLTVTSKASDGATWQTRYAHMLQVKVHDGDQVSKGQELGLSGGVAGAPGAGNSTGPHLHFEIRKNDNAIDPCTMFHCPAIDGNFP